MGDEFKHIRPGAEGTSVTRYLSTMRSGVLVCTPLTGAMISDLPMDGPERARAICQNCPFSNSEGVERIEGFGRAWLTI